jgi:hypothetical protein
MSANASLIDCNPSRLILAEQLGRRSSPRLILEIDIGDLLSVTTKRTACSQQNRAASRSSYRHDHGRLRFLNFLTAYRDPNHVATSSKLTIGTGDQDDAIALALASDMTATELDVSEIAVLRHRCQRLARSHTLKIHG